MRTSTLLLSAVALGLPAVASAQDPTPEPMGIPAPTMDTNDDGTMDAWDRDGDGRADAWDTTGDGQPDALDNDGDGEPDAPSEPEQ